MVISTRLRDKSIDLLARLEHHDAYRLLFDSRKRMERAELMVLLRNVLLHDKTAN